MGNAPISPEMEVSVCCVFIGSPGNVVLSKVWVLLTLHQSLQTGSSLFTMCSLSCPESLPPAPCWVFQVILPHTHCCVSSLIHSPLLWPPILSFLLFSSSKRSDPPLPPPPGLRKVLESSGSKHSREASVFPSSKSQPPHTSARPSLQPEGTPFFWVLLVPMLSHFHCVQLCETLWTIDHQAPLSMGFSRKQYWSGLQRPPPGDLPDPGIEPASLTYSALAGRFFTNSATWEAPHLSKDCGLSRCKTSHCPRSSPSQSSEEGLLDSSPLQRIVSLNPPNSSKIRLSANSLRRNGGSEKLIHLPRVTQLVSGRAGGPGVRWSSAQDFLHETSQIWVCLRDPKLHGASLVWTIVHLQGLSTVLMAITCVPSGWVTGRLHLTLKAKRRRSKKPAD